VTTSQGLRGPAGKCKKALVITFGLMAILGWSGSAFPQPWASSGVAAHSTLASVTGTAAGYGFSVEANLLSVTSTAAASRTIVETRFVVQRALTEDAEGALYEDNNSRRSNLIICIEIAKRVSAEPLTLTQIALLTRLNFKQAKVCIEKMIAAGLLQHGIGIDDGRFTLTRRGLDFLESGERTVRLIQHRVNKENGFTSQTYPSTQ
jgi:predicted transcriptional regulator